MTRGRKLGLKPTSCVSSARSSVGAGGGAPRCDPEASVAGGGRGQTAERRRRPQPQGHNRPRSKNQSQRDAAASPPPLLSPQVEELQQSLLTQESEAELLRSQLHAVSREKLGHAQEVTDLQRALDDARNKVRNEK